MGYRVDNAIIMAAGLSSRFAPISYEKPKALIEVKGEVLIERQICQLQERGITDIIVVVGYKKEQFYYLKEKYGVMLVENAEYQARNNNSSIYVVRQYIKNSYICSADNYFEINPFQKEEEESFYAAVFADGKTNEWCLETDSGDYITMVTVGGQNQWYMLGHAFWSQTFTEKFIQILEEIYENKSTGGKLWEDIYRENISKLKMKIKRYERNQIYEFDSLDELRKFDPQYKNNSGSLILQFIAKMMHCEEAELTEMEPYKTKTGDVIGVAFLYKKNTYIFEYESRELRGDRANEEKN